MPHSTTPPKTPAPAAKKKYVPLEPEKPMTEAEILEQTAAHNALAAMASMSKNKLSDSMWASPQYNKRIQASFKPAKAVGANEFFRNAAKSGTKTGSGHTATALNTPPTTPPMSFNVHAPSFVGGGSQGSSKIIIDGVTGEEILFTYNSDNTVTISRSPAQVAVPVSEPSQPKSASAPQGQFQVQPLTSAPAPAPAPQVQAKSAPVEVQVVGPALHRTASSSANVPPHLRGIATTATPSLSASATAQAPPPSGYVPPHLRRPAQTQSVPPSQGVASTQAQPTQTSAQYTPPHLRGIKSARPSPASASSPQQSAVASPTESTNPHLQGVVVAQPQSVQPDRPAAEFTPPHLRGIETSRPSPLSPTSSQGPAASPPTQLAPPHLQGVVASPSQPVQSSTAEYTPPHLRGIKPARHSPPTQLAPVQPPPTYTLPHLRRAESSTPPTQITPPHLRGVSHQSQVSPPTQVIHQTVPPHLRGVSSAKLSPPSTAATTQVHNTTPFYNAVGTTMAPSSYPSAHPMDPDQDAFVKWLGQKNAAKKVENAEKAAEKVTIKSEEPPKPVQAARVSPSKESVNSNKSQGSLCNLNDTDAFLKHIQTKAPPKNYGNPRKASRSPKRTSPNNGWQRPTTAFDNPRWKLNDDTVANFETYIKSGVTAPLATTAQSNTVYGSANVRAAKAQAAPVVAPKFQLPHQKPTFSGVQKLGQNTKSSIQNALAVKAENLKPTQVVVKVENPASSLNSAGPKNHFTLSNPTQVKANEWQGMPSMQSVAAQISFDINTVQPESASNAPPLTQTALVLQTGFKTVDEIHRSDGRISSTGLGGVSSDCAQDPRHTQGNDSANQLTDWDGAWAPAPVNWETERTSFDDSFIPAYIKEWQQTLPGGLHSVNIQSDKFTSGVYAINNVFFVDPVDHGPPTIPDTAENTQDQELKRLWQTANIEANNYMVAVEKKQKQEKRAIKASNMRFREIASQEPEPNTFSPAIDMYMRPAEEKDATDVVAIYNWYISNTTIPEDQVPIGIEDGKWLIKQAKEDNLPFLVAIKGRQPTSADAQGRPSPAKKIIMPAVESVIGFCFPERFNYGFAGNWKGRSRATVTLQLYVHNEHTRKGVGRNLLDRLIHCLNPGYAYKNAAAWINPSHEKLYETEGAGLFHQLLFQIPVEQQHDPNIDWLTKFLLKFLFKENNSKEGGVDRPQRLKSVARSSTKGRTAHFLDLAMFRYEARQAGEFDPYM